MTKNLIAWMHVNAPDVFRSHKALERHTEPPRPLCVSWFCTWASFMKHPKYLVGLVDKRQFSVLSRSNVQDPYTWYKQWLENSNYLSVLIE